MMANKMIIKFFVFLFFFMNELLLLREWERVLTLRPHLIRLTQPDSIEITFYPILNDECY